MKPIKNADTKISASEEEKINEVEIKEVKKPSEPLVKILIDPTITDGGLRTNDKLYVGWVTVPQNIADDLQRRQDECQEVKNFLQNPGRAKMRIKNFYVMEKQFLADPAENFGKKGFTKEYGLLDPWQWQFIPKEVQEELKRTRNSIYGY